MDEIVIIGDGGHSKVVQEIVMYSQHKVVAILDDKYKNVGKKKNVLYGPLSLCKQVMEKKERKLFIAIGDNKRRSHIVQRLGFSQDRYISLVHPSAVVSHSAQIGIGSIIMANCVIQPDTKIGNYAIINTGAIIEHDSVIEDYVHISPRVTLCGHVAVHEGSHVGAGAVVIPNIEIGSWSVVGAGAVVIRHVDCYDKVVGIPATSKQKEGVGDIDENV